MPVLLAAAFWLVVTVHGEVTEQSGPLTGEACVLQMAFKILQVERAAVEGMWLVIDGRLVSPDGVEIACLPGERAT